MPIAKLETGTATRVRPVQGIRWPVSPGEARPARAQLARGSSMVTWRIPPVNRAWMRRYWRMNSSSGCVQSWMKFTEITFAWSSSLVQPKQGRVVV